MMMGRNCKICWAVVISWILSWRWTISQTNNQNWFYVSRINYNFPTGGIYGIKFEIIPNFGGVFWLMFELRPKNTAKFYIQRNWKRLPRRNAPRQPTLIFRNVILGGEGGNFSPYGSSIPIGFFVHSETPKNTQSGFESLTFCSPAELLSA